LIPRAALATPADPSVFNRANAGDEIANAT
jgi:hypothetical protein